MGASFDLVVASHLRWTFVWQRPQQLLSRLASRRRILFVEEPVYSDGGSASPVLAPVAENITVLAPRVNRPERDGTPVWEDRAAISEQVRYAMQMLRFRDRGLWFYTPAPEFLLHTVEPGVVVYDVMDELSNFKFAPPQLKEQEQRLLRRADVVFTGGASLYEAKCPFNPNSHLFASGVDTAHYSRACRPDTPVPDYIASVPAPRAAYVGVIDERLDYEIVGLMAARRPDVQFLMVGPIVKIDPATLPQGPNLHYLGQRPYEELPRILKGVDACLMPFARNEATRYISPTKTLEYMAAHRPIVSTPIRDVERFYSDIVFLARNPEEFVHQLGAALEASSGKEPGRSRRVEKILADHSWDHIAACMDRLIEKAFRARGVARKPEPSISRRRGLPIALPSLPSARLAVAQKDGPACHAGPVGALTEPAPTK